MIREGRNNVVLNMPYELAEEPAWWRIGESLRDYFELRTELPPKLLTLVRKLDAIEGNYLLRNLDAMPDRTSEQSVNRPL